MRLRLRLLIVLLTSAIIFATPAVTTHARPGGWGGSGWGNPTWGPGPGDPFGNRSARREPIADRSREGRITVSRFVADAALAAKLGHGAITVASQSSGESYLPEADRAAFEAAMIDHLIKAGYDTTQVHAANGQLAELTVTHSLLAPAEIKKPVSGAAAISVGNRGSAYGLALDVDLSKPLPALVSTRLEARIRDRATGAVLWEGRAEVATREGDSEWTDQIIAARLAGALLDGFPSAADALPSPE